MKYVAGKSTTKQSAKKLAARNMYLLVQDMSKIKTKDIFRSDYEHGIESEPPNEYLLSDPGNQKCPFIIFSPDTVKYLDEFFDRLNSSKISNAHIYGQQKVQHIVLRF